MKKLLIHCFVLLVAGCFVFAACNKESSKTGRDTSQAGSRYRIDSLKFREALAEAVESADSVSKSLYNAIYTPRHYSGYWFSEPGKFKSKAENLRNTVSNAHEHGVNPSHFEVDKVMSAVSEVDIAKPDYKKMARAELLLSKLFFDYCAGMRFGFFNPMKLYPKDYFTETQKPDSAYIQMLFSSPDSLMSILRRAPVQSIDYWSMQGELKKTEALLDSNFAEIAHLPEKKTIKFGERHPSVPLIARRLMITGELPYTAKYDSVFATFNDSVLQALNRFREKYNLLTDREIGNKTIEALNRNFKEQYWVIAANLERVRWRPKKDISNKYVHVNVANMTLRALRGDTLVQMMKVVVGKPPKQKTPMLYGKMYEVVLNPTWTVPNSIIINEISKRVPNDPSYLRRNNMRVYKNRIQVDPVGVPWSRLGAKFQPYVIVQDSGASNSLGRLKFNFSNPFSVYLHDTNSKLAFGLHYRGLSHGCVRVEKPLALAFFCLRDADSRKEDKVKERDVLHDRIRYSIGLKPKTEAGTKALEGEEGRKKLKRLELKPGVTVLLDYRTCFINENMEVQFCNDHYKMDSLLIARLKKL